MGCLSSKQSALSDHTASVLSRYHLTPTHITKAYHLFSKIQAKHNRTKTPLQLKLEGDRPTIRYDDLRHTFAIPPSMLAAHLLDLVPCERQGELSFPEWLELAAVVCLMSREQLVSFGYHAFAVNEADELHLSDFVAGLTELKEVYPRIINGADIPVTKLGLLAQTTIDTVHAPHSTNTASTSSTHSTTATTAAHTNNTHTIATHSTTAASTATATATAVHPATHHTPTPHHLTLSTFRQVMLNQPWFLDLLCLVQEQFQRKTRSERDWAGHLALLRARDKGVLAGIDEIVKRRVPGGKKGLLVKTARGSDSGAAGKHVRRQSTVHTRAMERIGRRQSSVLPEAGIQELRREMAELVEEEQAAEFGQLSGEESSRSRAEGSTHPKSALRRPSVQHGVMHRRRSSVSNHQQPDEPPAADDSPSLSSRKMAHQRNHTVHEASSLSKPRHSLDGRERDDGTGPKGLHRPSQSHAHKAARMKSTRTSVDVAAMDRGQQQHLHTLARNNGDSGDDKAEAEGGEGMHESGAERKGSVVTAEAKQADEEARGQAGQLDAPFSQPRDSRSQLGKERKERASVTSETGPHRTRTHSGLSRVTERVSREDDTAPTGHVSDESLSPSLKSSSSSPPSHARRMLPAPASSSSVTHKRPSHSPSNNTDAADARAKPSAVAQGDAASAVQQRLHPSLDEQDDQLTRLQVITAQKKLSVSTMHRRSSVARASVDDPGLAEGDACDAPRRGSVMRDNPSSRASPHQAERVIGEVSSSLSTSPTSVQYDMPRRRNDSVSREDEQPAHSKRGSVSRENGSPVHSEAYRKELLHDGHDRYGSSPNLRPDRASTSLSYPNLPYQAALQHTRTVPPSSHHAASSHSAASPLQPGSLRPSISGSPYPHSRQASLSMHPVGAWEAGGVGGEMMAAGGLYRTSFSGLQGGVIGGPPPAGAYGFAPSRMSLSLSPQQAMPHQQHY